MENYNVALFGLVGVIIGAAIQLLIYNKGNYIKYVTEERQKWRVEIRELIGKLYEENPNYSDIMVKFQIRLNPFDNEDKKIIDKFKELLKSDDSPYKEEHERIKIEIAELTARLLKHDWERVKLESNKLKVFPTIAQFVILLTTSIFIQYTMFSNIQWGILEIVKNLLGNDIAYHVLTTLFLMVWILIIKKIVIIFSKKKSNDELRSGLFDIPRR